MDTEIYGQVPIYSREQLRRLYAKAVKASFDDFSLDKLVETGITPFPNDSELSEYSESVEVGLNMALDAIEESEVTDLPDFFMIDTSKRNATGEAAVWVVADGEVIDFTQTAVLKESGAGA